MASWYRFFKQDRPLEIASNWIHTTCRPPQCFSAGCVAMAKGSPNYVDGEKENIKRHVRPRQCDTCAMLLLDSVFFCPAAPPPPRFVMPPFMIALNASHSKHFAFLFRACSCSKCAFFFFPSFFRSLADSQADLLADAWLRHELGGVLRHRGGGSIPFFFLSTS